MNSDKQLTHFKSSAIPVAVVSLVVLAAQLGYEFSLPADGPEREAALKSGPAWAVRLVGAAVLSLVTLLLPRGLYLDRVFIRSRDDRLAGEYLAAGALVAMLSIFCGAVLGVVVGVAVIASVPILRRESADPRGPVARDARNTVFLVLAASLLLVGARESYSTYLQWADGYGLSRASQSAFADDHGGRVVMGAALVVAVLVALLLPLAVHRHRRRLSEARSVYVWSAVAVTVLSLIAQNWPGVVIGLLCFLATLVFSRRPGGDEGIADVGR